MTEQNIIEQDVHASSSWLNSKPQEETLLFFRIKEFQTTQSINHYSFLRYRKFKRETWFAPINITASVSHGICAASVSCISISGSFWTQTTQDNE